MAETKIEQLQNVPEWVEANRAFFLPPVCNKLMHGKGQLKVMFVGGPNVRKDYHIEEGEELFFQLKGHMVVKIMEKGQPKDVRIEEGEIFVLPGRIPHSPQRFENTVGLVVERERLEHERDGLRYYQPSDPTQPLWEKWFYCHDLGVQLGPVIKEYFASEAHATGQVQPGSVAEKPLVQVDTTTEVVAPISLAKWVDTHAATIGKEPLAMFSAGEIKVLAYTAAQGAYAVPADQTAKGEMWLWQYRGNSILNTAETGDIRLATGDSFLVQKGQRVTWTQEGADAVGLSVRMEPQNRSLAIVQTGDPVLRQGTQKVDPAFIQTEAFRALVARMVAAMRAAPGVGLAAPQIGEPLSVFVMEDREELMAALTPLEKAERARVVLPLHVVVNPVWRPIGEAKATFFEGCLSVAGFAGLVERWAEVEVEGLDQHGQPISLRLSGWPARIVQHECDHLAGTLYIDRMATRSFCTHAHVRSLYAGKPIAEVRSLLGV